MVITRKSIKLTRLVILVFSYHLIVLYAFSIYALFRNSSIRSIIIRLPLLFIIGAILIYLLRMAHGRIKTCGPLAGIDFMHGTTVQVGEDRPYPRRIKRLLKRLHSTSERKRREAIEQLVKLGRNILPCVFYYCREEGDDYRLAVLEVIDRVHPNGLVQAVIEGLHQTDLHSEWQICKIIRDMGEKATPAIPTLISILKKRGNVPFNEADQALTGIGITSVRPLIELLLDQNAPVEARSMAATIIRDCLAYSNEDVAKLKSEAIEAMTFIIDKPEELSTLRDDVAECLRIIQDNGYS